MRTSFAIITDVKIRNTGERLSKGTLSAMSSDFKASTYHDATTALTAALINAYAQNVLDSGNMSWEVITAYRKIKSPVRK